MSGFFLPIEDFLNIYRVIFLSNEKYLYFCKKIKAQC